MDVVNPLRIVPVALGIACVLLVSAASAVFEFTQSQPFSVDVSARFVAAGDFNADGRIDLAVVGRDRIVVAYGNMEETTGFSNLSEFHADGADGRPGVGDLTGDGVPELVIPNLPRKGVSIVFPVAEGGPSLFELVGQRPSALALADFDLDGALDIAVAAEATNTVTVLLNRGVSPVRFRSGPVIEVGTGPTEIFALDVDADGRVDIATLDRGSEDARSISIRWNDPGSEGPSFGELTQLEVGSQVSSLSIADLNRDGPLDFVMLDQTIRSSGSDIVVFRGAGDREFGEPVRQNLLCPFYSGGLACPARRLSLGDFDLDGTLDAAVLLADPRRRNIDPTSPRTGVLQIFAGAGDGSFVAGPIMAMPKLAADALVFCDTACRAPQLGLLFDKPARFLALASASSPGGAGNGEPCRDGSECLTGVCTEGVCCAGICEDNESCAMPRREGTCQRHGDGFLPCISDEECFDIPNVGDSGICVDGVCCDSRCDNGRCDFPGFWGRCVPLLSPGDECCDDYDCSTGFCRDGRCCRDACADGFCGGDASGVCYQTQPLGELCFRDEHCESGVCDILGQPVGRCSEPLEPGRECELDNQCDSLICDRFSGVCCAEFCHQSENCDDPRLPGICMPITCEGDCDGNGKVAVHELVIGVSIALDRRTLDDCRRFDRNGDRIVTVDELVASVRVALYSCVDAAVLDQTTVGTRTATDRLVSR